MCDLFNAPTTLDTVRSHNHAQANQKSSKILLFLHLISNPLCKLNQINPFIETKTKGIDLIQYIQDGY
jgi:hypothetical protein